MAPKASVTIAVKYNHLPAIADSLKPETVATIHKAAFDIEAAAKAKAPVRTGTLRRSIHTLIEQGGLVAKIGPSVDYGLYVEMGTRHMAARPYLRPAAELVYPRFTEAMKALAKRSKP